MTLTPPDAIRDAETILEEALSPLAAELRLVDVADFIAFIRCEKFANVRDLVDSSIDLFFAPGVLRYAFGADYIIDWTRAPVVILDLEFQSAGVDLCFKLRLDGAAHRVLIERNVQSKSDLRPLGVQLREALAHAKLRN